MKRVLSLVSILIGMCAVEVQASGRAEKSVLRDKHTVSRERGETFVIVAAFRCQVAIVGEQLQKAIEQRGEQAMQIAAQRHQERAVHDAQLEAVLDQVAKKRRVNQEHRSAL